MIIKTISISKKFKIVIVLFLVACTLAIGHATAQDIDKKITGRWYMRNDLDFPEFDYKTIYHAVQEFYPNGTMTEERQILGKFKDAGVVYSCHIVSDYSWSVSGNVLYQKLLANNGTIEFYTLNGEDASPSDFARKVCDIDKKYILKTSAYKIIKIDDKENLYSQVDSNGKEVIKRDLRTQFDMLKYKIKK